MNPPRAALGEHPLDRLLCRWTDAAGRRALLTLCLVSLASVGFGAHAASSLGINVDPNSFFSQDLRFQQAIRRFEQYFPVLTNSLLVVVEGETPELTRRAGERLLVALDERRDVYHRAFQPGEDRFFERHALLYRSVDELHEFADNMALLQPVLGELGQDMSLPTLTRVLRLGLQQDDAGTRGVEGWRNVLDHLRIAIESIRLGDRRALSWESVLIRSSGFEPPTRTVIVADPILDLERVLAAERSIEVAYASAERLGLTPEAGFRVRVTGYPAVNHEEMLGLANDTGLAGGLAFLGVVAVLSYAFRSWRLVVASAVTLALGLVWAAAFAGTTVGELNPMSICFGVLVIGLGIDFIIHFGMHYVDRVAGGEPSPVAVQGSVRDVGRALVFCAATTSVGFLAFVPTDFRGISDMGLAAVGGILALLFLTLTLLPALIALCMGPGECERLRRRRARHGIRLPRPSNPLAVVIAALLAGFAALPLLPRIDLDSNVLNLRNPEQESVKTFRELLESRRTTPWYLDALVPSLDQAVALSEEMRELPQVEIASTLEDFIPEEQEAKLEILADVQLMLGLPEVPTRKRAESAAQREALQGFATFLADPPIPPDSPLRPDVDALHGSLAGFLDATAGETDAASTRRLADALLDPLPEQLQRLVTHLEVEAIGRAELPPTLVERMLSEDGHARIQVHPSQSLWDHDAMVDFVEAIRQIWGDITGLPVNLVESARATWRSLRMALVGATLAISLMLLALWRSLSDAAVVLLPLLLAVLLCQVSVLILPTSLNYGNVIVLPLLLGVGVDGGIHIVQRARADPRALLESTTAQAVFFSALTTVASFGTLVITGHRGVASLGWLLVVGMVFTLLANLVLLPALLTLRARRRASAYL